MLIQMPHFPLTQCDSHKHINSWDTLRGKEIPPIFLSPSFSMGNESSDSKPLPLTWDQGPGLHSGGQAWLLQTWTWVGVLTGQRECNTASSFWKGFFWTHWTFRLCWPPAHDRLHTLHSPGFQLSVKDRITSGEAKTKDHQFQSSYCERVTTWWKSKVNCRTNMANSYWFCFHRFSSLRECGPFVGNHMESPRDSGEKYVPVLCRQRNRCHLEMWAIHSFSQLGS